MTAFELLALVLVMGSIAALCGWAGGAGARLTFAARIDRVEGLLMQILNRAKGAAGGQVAQVQKQRFNSAEKEAEALAAKLQAAPRRGRFGRPVLSSADAAEEASFQEIEREQQKAREAKGAT